MPTPKLPQEKCDEALAAVDQHGSVTAAAEALGLSRGTLQSRVDEARRRKSGMVVTGRSTLTDLRTGEPVMEWVKETRDREEEARQAAFKALSAELPRAAPVSAPSVCSEALCNLYSYFDFHVGMLAWRKEGGEDWDLTIAERTLQQSYAAMVTQAPAAKKAIIARHACCNGEPSLNASSSKR